MEEFTKEMEANVPKGFKGGCYFGVEKPNAEPEKTFRGLPIKWSEYIVPCDDQGDEPSCVGRSWCGFLEAMIRYNFGKGSIPKGKQLDAHAVWKYARDKWWGGTYTDGIYVHQGFQSLKDLGMIPDDSQILIYRSTISNLRTVLQYSPVVLGHMITDGWFTTLPNGCINHTLKGKDTLGGHAILDLEMINNSGQDAILFQNSWGVKNWGYHGLGIMNANYWEKTVDNCFYSVRFGSKWNSNFDGWKRFLVNG